MNIKSKWYLSCDEIESDIKCPYCGYVFDDSYEMLPDEDDSDIIECDCGKSFTAKKCITVDFRTNRSCGDNNEKHEWKKSTNEKLGELSYFCVKCGIYGELIQDEAGQ